LSGTNTLAYLLTESEIQEKRFKNIDTWFFGARVRIVPFIRAESEKEYMHF
jgi:hypothetical protein